MIWQFTTDSALFLRCLLAVLWGIGWAWFLQRNRLGAFLALERTWVTVVVGVGVDLLLAIGGDWLTCALVVVGSSLGIIGRSLLNESRFEPDLNSYRTKWGMEDGIDAVGDTIGMLERALRSGSLPAAQALCSESLARLHQAQRTLTTARYGAPETTRRSR